MPDNDRYGSNLRQKMKESMSEPFRPLNRKEDGYLSITDKICGVLVVVISVLIALEVIVHTWRHFYGN